MIDDNILKRLKDNASPFRELEFTPETWESEFGENQTVKTPVGDVTLGRNQYWKLRTKRREKYFGLIRPTLTDPLYVVEVHDPKEGAERDTKRIYIKPFIGEGGNTYFTSITIQKDGKEISISSHQKNAKDLMRYIKNGEVLYSTSAPVLQPAASRPQEHPTSAGGHLDDAYSVPNYETPVKPTEENNPDILKRLKDNAAPFRELEFTPETWEREFGENQTVKTPVGDVTLGRNQYWKLRTKRREKYFGLIRPTLTDPLYVVEVHDPKEGAERDTKRIYIKPFIDKDKNTYFTSITIQKDGKEISISSHPKEPEYLIKSIKKGRMLYDTSARGIYIAASMPHEHPANAGRPLD
ncbi:PBECR2 nuclease fold domain-containing protein [Candidatus Magnetominusculus dajiuhuensis]|uniref:PBECR2 nuclease fold domain-containing protein n=1 Tax=Candidatus Magnetominusculus dajiuhuensis TaxID=3137712 RepID=UPI003B42D351